MPADAGEVPKLSVGWLLLRDGIVVMVPTCQGGPGDALNNSCGQGGPRGYLLNMDINSHL